LQDRKNCTSVAAFLGKSNNLRTVQLYARDVEKIGRFVTKRKHSGSMTRVPCSTHGLKYNSIWNEIPFYHVMDPGSLAPCIQHDLFGGIGRSDMSYILIDLAKQHHITWDTLRIKLKKMRDDLKNKDRRDLMVKITGRYNCNTRMNLK
jgi:hypothetical protein